jgi:large conductance mechanosensitive channel
MLQGFGKFLMRGNVVDLAVAVVVGGAFGTIVNALVKDLITPLIAALVGKPDFSALTFQINSSKFLYGDFINAVVSFLLITSVIYFLIIVPMNSLTMRLGFKTEETVLGKCPECLSEIPPQARRCKFCTAVLS